MRYFGCDCDITSNPPIPPLHRGTHVKALAFATWGGSRQLCTKRSAAGGNVETFAFDSPLPGERKATRQMIQDGRLCGPPSTPATSGCTRRPSRTIATTLSNMNDWIAGLKKMSGERRGGTAAGGGRVGLSRGVKGEKGKPARFGRADLYPGASPPWVRTRLCGRRETKGRADTSRARNRHAEEVGE